MTDLKTKWLPLAAVVASLWAGGMTSAQAATCTAFNDFTNPDATLTDSIACGDGTLDANDNAERVNLAEPSLLEWTELVEKVDASGTGGTFSNTGTLGSFSYTTADRFSGTWSLTLSTTAPENDRLSLADHDFLIVIKDGSVDKLAPSWFWFILDETNPSDFTCADGVTLCGGWTMYGEPTGPDDTPTAKQISHMSVYYVANEGGTPPQEVPEPGPLSLLGLGLMGLWFARRKINA